MSQVVSFRQINLKQENWSTKFLKTFQELLDNNKSNSNYCYSHTSIPPNFVAKDVLPKRLDHIDEIAQFETKIGDLESKIEKEYRGPCFDQTYRVLTELCCQYQQELDTINVDGKPQIRLRRKQCLVRVDNAATQLNNKAHTGGIPCSKCTVRK